MDHLTLKPGFPFSKKLHSLKKPMIIIYNQILCQLNILNTNDLQWLVFKYIWILLESGLDISSVFKRNKADLNLMSSIYLLIEKSGRDWFMPLTGAKGNKQLLPECQPETHDSISNIFT